MNARCRRCVPGVSFRLLSPSPSRPVRERERENGCKGRKVGQERRAGKQQRQCAKKKGRPAKQTKLTNSAEGFNPEIKSPSCSS
jgi:hypothetical protein